MRVLVTGAAGFIGSHLARRLVELGHEVVGLDDLSAGLEENVHPSVRFSKLDIRSRDIYDAFAGVDAVFHLAAKNCLADCLQDPVATAEINVAGTANVLEAARKAGVSKVVYADTSAEYEGITEFPSRVDRVAPLSVYARSKRAGALFCEAYQAFHGVAVTTLRYFNVYGPAQDWRRTIPPVMSAFAIKLLKGERPTVYGTGEKRRDFVYVEDVTDFNVLALFDSRTEGRVFNVGTGVNHSVNEIFKEIEAVLETALTPVYAPELAGEAEVTLADITNDLGWAPKVSLRDGILSSIDYIREHVLR